MNTKHPYPTPFDRPLRERDGKLVENWYVACVSHELKTGKPLARKIYDENLVLFRDSNGKPACLPDRCLHRAVKLSEGKCESGTLRCPYHGWQYAASGKVLEIPSEGHCPTSREIVLKPRPCVEKQGLIWVWMGESAPSTPEPSWDFLHYGDPNWSHYFMITDFDNEVTNLAENFSDVPHTIFVHDKWFRSKAHQNVPIRLDVENGRVLITYEQPSDSIGWTRWIVNPKGEPMFHTDEFVYPNLTRTIYQFGPEYAFVINSQSTPVSTMKSRVYTYICYRTGPFTALMNPFFRIYTRVVIEQDVVIMKNQGDNLRAHPPAPFRATDADEIHLAIERLREMGAKGDPNLLSFKKSKEKSFWI